MKNSQLTSSTAPSPNSVYNEEQEQEQEEEIGQVYQPQSHTIHWYTYWNL